MSLVWILRSGDGDGNADGDGDEESSAELIKMSTDCCKNALHCSLLS